MTSPAVDTGGGAQHHGAVRHRHVVIAVFPDVQGLDVFGPADVFYFANYIAEQRGEPAPYTIEIAAAEPGVLRTASGPRLVVDRSVSDPDLRPDVLLIAGGLAVVPAAEDQAYIAAVSGLASRSGEVGSVCTGALVLANAGLLEGRQATTHWALAEMLTKTHPDVAVDADRIYLYDGVWTSAGVTAGIDLALQLLRTHHGTEMAAAAAKHLVVYLERAGGQQQYSAHLAAQRTTHTTLSELMVYIADHPERDLTVRALAERLHMSERSLQRLFTAEVGITPAAYVERVRIDAARRLLELTEQPVAAVASACGFDRVETLYRAFKRVMGVTPVEYRERHARSPRDRVAG